MTDTIVIKYKHFGACGQQCPRRFESSPGATREQAAEELAAADPQPKEIIDVIHKEPA